MKLPLIDVVTVNFNGKKHLKPLFKSLSNLNYPKERMHIIMVDNGSTDGSVEYVKKSYSNVKIVRNDLNNFCKANNIAIKQSKAEFVALVNNDTVVDKNWLIELVKVAQLDNRIGVVTSKILFLDGRLQGAGHVALPNFYWADRGFREKDKGQYDEVEELSSVSHCSVLYRRKCLNDDGLLDEDFEMYMEDMDMSIRMRSKEWKMFYAPKSVVYHKVHGTATEAEVCYFCERNRLLLIAKHYPDRLATELYGKGYFTTLNSKKDVASMLSSVFIKLLKSHNNNVVLSLTTELFTELDKILNLEKDDLLKQLEMLRDSISEKERLISEKDGFIQARSGELPTLKQELDRILSILAERDRTLGKNHADIDNLNKMISDKNNEISSLRDELSGSQANFSETIAEKERILSEKVREIEGLYKKEELYNGLEKQIIQKAELLRSKDMEILSLRKEIDRIYSSETYKMVRPLWKILSLLKKIKSLFSYIKCIVFSKKGKGLCFSYFSSLSKEAKCRDVNKYNIKVTNDTDKEQQVKVRIKTTKDDVIYAYVSKKLDINPRTSLEVMLDCDWDMSAFWHINGSLSQSDEFWKKDLKEPGFYSLNAELFDKNGVKIDRLGIFQRLEI
ncbi:MAG: glycosyltransferase [Candidatus Omnitrophota bacterium]